MNIAEKIKIHHPGPGFSLHGLGCKIEDENDP
jgi:hypothetical protein